MKLLLRLLVVVGLAQAATDPVFEAYKAWDAQHPRSDHKARAQSLFAVSAEWVAKWPDSRLAWDVRRQSLLETGNRSAELWKQVDEQMIRLSPPHTFVTLAAYDWVTYNINLKDAVALLTAELDWYASQPKRAIPEVPTLAFLVEEANLAARPFDALCTLASAQIQMKELEPARKTIGRMRDWLDGDFRKYFDPDPLEAYPDYESKYFIRSAELARAEGRKVDALAFYHHVVANPWYRRAYPGGYAKAAQEVWKETGGTDEGWAAFSQTEALPVGAPGAYRGVGFMPWVALKYRLPEMKVPGLDSRTWTVADFQGKTTIVYLWAAWCGPCWMHLPAVQSLYDKIKGRGDIQIVTLSVDEDRGKLAAFMKEKGYTFPVMVSKPYVEKLLPKMILGQHWIVDRTGSIRLQRTTNMFNGVPQAFVDEAVYKLMQVARLNE